MGIFHPVTEKEVTRAIFSSFSRHLSDCVESEVIIVGGGPSGLVAGREMARAGLKVLIIERNNYPGGGFWIGGYFMNKLTLRAPAQELLEELGVPFEQASPGLYVADAIHACSRVVAAACDAGVRFLNLTLLEDVVVREGDRVGGVVINWSPVVHLPEEIRALDPVPLESKLVIDATGHDAVVVRKLEKRGPIKTGSRRSALDREVRGRHPRAHRRSAPGACGDGHGSGIGLRPAPDGSNLRSDAPFGKACRRGVL